MPFDILSMKFLLACAASVLAGLLLRGLLALALRRWPALAAQRAVWLAAQAVLLAVFALTLAPRSAQLTQWTQWTQWNILPRAALLPALQPVLPKASTAQASPAATGPAAPHTRRASAPALADQRSADTAAGSGTRDSAASAWEQTLDSLPLLWLCLYGSGLSLALWRQWHARRLWKALLSGATRLDREALHEHGGFTLEQQQEIARHAIAVLEIPAAISPMLAGARHALLLLPEHLRSFPAAQQQMIIEHELTHWRRHDPALMSLALLLRTVFWFNPALPWLSGKLACAQELSCDSTVLAGRPLQLRQQYAAALLAQFKAQTQMLNWNGSAFGGSDSASVAERIKQLRGTVSRQPGIAAKCLLGIILTVPLAVSLLLQPAMALPPEAGSVAQQPSAAAALAPPAATTAAAQTWRYPLEQMHVSSFFGVSRKVLATPHKGIDLAAGKGTPVFAAAAGRVVAAGELAINDGRYGNTVIIEHGGQRSLYAHLDSIAVQVGAEVAAGQRIGKVGETGLATGPHLHFEVLQGEQRLDPQTMLANLDQHASKRALRQRREQLGH
ncbi:peptidoglycan DD-metalloendopeptidase family protein [Oxalobacteraceae bacterium]|nr:peptidoglycan DD-metalloendopeptidase family protein [Oxalobacteraceae bacterium]